MIRNTIFRIFLLLPALLPGWELWAQVNVQKVKPETTLVDKQGVFYALPLTVLKVDVEVKKTEYYAGPYAEYARKYLDMEGVITSDYNEYTMLDVKLSSVVVPDPENYYFAEIDEKLIKDGKAVILSLSETGLLTGIDGSVAKNDLAGRDISIALTGEEKSLFNYMAGVNLYETFDTIIQKVVVDTVTVERVFLEPKWVEKTDEQKAVEAANMIDRIRQSRFNLLTGYQEIPYEGSTISYMDRELKKMEKEYLSLFTGISIEKKINYSFTVIPDAKEQPGQIPVFVFSDRTGVKDVNAAGGEKIWLKIEKTGDIKTLEKVTQSRDEASKSGRGFYYRIPFTAKVKLEIGSDLKVEKLIPISQYGTTSYLPAMISVVQFHPWTGGVSKIVIE